MLDSPITLKETQRAISSLQAGKTPGEDGLPSEFYKTYSEPLAEKLQGVLMSSSDAASLPVSRAASCGGAETG